jgi:hypothetical protein
MHIQLFPKFRPLSLEDVHTFNKVLKEDQPVLSEYTFTNLYSWRQAYHFEVAQFEGFLIVRSGAATSVRFLKPIGQGDIKKAMVAILKETKGVFFRLPESTISLFEKESGFQTIADEDNYDYLYKAPVLIGLAGRKFDGKRNLIKKFAASYDYEYLDLDASHMNECLDFQQRWCTIKDCESVEGLKNERRAINEMIHHCEVFDLIAGAIRVEGKIVAVAIAQRLNQDTLVMHVLKADPNMPGLYQTINNEFLKRRAGNYTYVNFEQDLGIEGLRKSKQSYYPLRMIPKYTLKLTP